MSVPGSGLSSSGVGQVDGRGARHAVPVPAVLHESARGGRDGVARADDRGRAVALVASVAVVAGVDLRTPDVRVVGLERHHPVAAAVDARGAVVIDEETRGRGTRRNALLLEEAVQLLVRAFQTQVGARQFGVRALAAARQVAQCREVAEGVDVGVGDAAVLAEGWRPARPSPQSRRSV